MSQRVTVGFCDGAHVYAAYFKQALSCLGSAYEFIYELAPARNPDVLIYSFFGNQHQQYTCRKVFVCGEPGDVSRHHQATLLIDCKNVAQFRSPRVPFKYLPFYVLSYVERFRNSPRDLIKSPTLDCEAILASKSKFCAFLYSQDVDFRNSLFDVISRYKAVDALGKARGVAGQATDRDRYIANQQTYNDTAVEKYRPYKFVICCENSRHPGYITEKIISAMLAHCIPIYLGAPDVVQHFNPDSFVHVGAHANWERAVALIKRLDTNPDMYCHMLRQPWFKGNVLPPCFSPDYLTSSLEVVIKKPISSILERINRRHRSPSISSASARVMRQIMSNRITALRATRAPVRKIRYTSSSESK